MSDQDTQEKEDFGQILAEFEQDAPAKSADPAVGQKVSGRILSIGEEWGFVDLGTKSEGRIAAAELKDAEGNLTVKEGDTLEATVSGELRVFEERARPGRATGEIRLAGTYEAFGRKLTISFMRERKAMMTIVHAAGVLPVR